MVGSIALPALFLSQDGQSESIIVHNLSETFDCCVLVSLDDVSVDSMSNSSSSLDSEYDLCLVVEKGKTRDKVNSSPDIPGWISKEILVDNEIDPKMPSLIPQSSTEDMDVEQHMPAWFLGGAWMRMVMTLISQI